MKIKLTLLILIVSTAAHSSQLPKKRALEEQLPNPSKRLKTAIKIRLEEEILREANHIRREALRSTKRNQLWVIEQEKIIIEDEKQNRNNLRLAPPDGFKADIDLDIHPETLSALQEALAESGIHPHWVKISMRDHPDKQITSSASYADVNYRLNLQSFEDEIYPIVHITAFNSPMITFNPNMSNFLAEHRPRAKATGLMLASGLLRPNSESYLAKIPGNENLFDLKTVRNHSTQIVHASNFLPMIIGEELAKEIFYFHTEQCNMLRFDKKPDNGSSARVARAYAILRTIIKENPEEGKDD